MPDGWRGWITTEEAEVIEAVQSGEGVVGPPGPPGPQGEAGIDGQPGYTPIKGIDYVDGEPGEQGPPGESIIGPKGDKGDTGDPGESIVGPKGDQGDPGESIVGPQGIPGQDGYTPVKDVDYFDGEDGAPGPAGQDGAPGAAGYTPVKGIDYFDGDDGAPGEQGIQGIQGVQGNPGPNQVSTSTDSSITGILKGASGKVAQAISGTDYAAVSHGHAPADVTGTAVITSDSRLSDARTPTAHGHAEADVTNLVTDLAAKEATANKAQANGYASLGADGKVPAAQLPSGSGGLGYALNVVAASLSTVTDSATYYFGSLAGLAPSTTAALARIYIPKAGAIKAAYVWTRAATAGTAENISVNVRLNNATDTLVATVGQAAATRLFSNTALNIAVVQGDYIEIKMVCPAWATNPATLAMGGVVYIES